MQDQEGAQPSSPQEPKPSSGPATPTTLTAQWRAMQVGNFGSDAMDSVNSMTSVGARRAPGNTSSSRSPGEAFQVSLAARVAGLLFHQVLLLLLLLPLSCCCCVIDLAAMCTDDRSLLGDQQRGEPSSAVGPAYQGILDSALSVTSRMSTLQGSNGSLAGSSHLDSWAGARRAGLPQDGAEPSRISEELSERSPSGAVQACDS